MSKRKLVLINPLGKRRSGFAVNKDARYPPLSLGIIAALTPNDWDIVLIDENFEKFSYEDADLVGLTSFTSNATRAYEIASVYRENNIPIVMGGIHASMMPDEALNYVNSVVTGEAESVWAELLSDFKEGELKKKYFGKLLPLENSPAARHDLFHPDYVFDSVQTTRGCPMSCNFCTVTAFNGRAYRSRPVNDVLDEIEQIKSKSIIFVDDNIVGYNKRARDHAKSIFRGMIERKIEKDWLCQASINFGDDEELLELAAKSGCRMVLIGVESEKTDALQQMNKRSNLRAGVDNYSEIFSKIQSFGISVLGTFIFGLETDTLEDLRARVQYIRNSNVDASQVSILTPFPGTDIYDDFKESNRITKTNYPADWELYDGGEVVIKPAKIKDTDLKEFKWELASNLFFYKRLVKKLSTTLKTTRNAKASVWAFSANAHYNNMIYEKDKSKHISVASIFGALVGKQP